MLFSFFTFSQTVRVVNEVTLQPIDLVYVYSKEKVVQTNIWGDADLNLFGNQDTLIFHHPSYKSYTISLNDLRNLNFTVYLVESVMDINEVVVSANRWEQNKREIPTKIATISSKKIAFCNPQTAADMVGSSNEVFVQKSQMGGGSPMIRGFSANRILLVIDGVRLNNAIYRSGNLQNVLSIDANSIEHTEIIFGPGSVIYGSDALGGVIDFHTLTPKLSPTDDKYFKLDALTRYSSANNEKTGHINFNFASKKWSSLTSITYSDFGDLKMGSIGNMDYTRPEYIERIQSKDSIIRNDDINLQKFSAYSQANFMQKFRYKVNKKLEFNYAVHFSTTSDIPRYDRLLQYNQDKLKYAEWYYGPQQWIMNNLNLKYSDSTLFFDDAKIILAHQNYTESRHDRKYGKENIRERTEKVNALSLNIDFNKRLTHKHSIFYGVEAVANLINSHGQERNIETQKIDDVASRYPDASTYTSYAMYLNSKSNFGKKTTILAGLRYSKVILNSNFDTLFYKFPFEAIHINTGALNGSFGIVFSPTHTLQINSNLSTGFRAPNIDDVGKVFDSEPGRVIVPNEFLKPEYLFNYDLGIVKTISENVQIEATAFYTILLYAMGTSDFSFDGQDSIMYDGEPSKVQAIINVNEAKIYGFQFSLYADIIKYLSFKANCTYTKGVDMNKLPIRHVAPFFSSAHLLYKHKNVQVDMYGNYNGEISNENLASSEQSKTHMYATDTNGKPYSPEWYTLNIKGSFQINKFVQINAGIENILDVRYRPYSSGIVAPGRNYIIGIRGNF